MAKLQAHECTLRKLMLLESHVLKHKKDNFVRKK
jgi:hypothetical protein